MGKIAFRDAVRSSFVGPLIRDHVIIPFRRHQRQAQAKSLTQTDPSKFTCPVCSYNGIFVHHRHGTKIVRQYALCPACGAAERHRLQANVLQNILPPFAAKSKSALHFAPEKFFVDTLRNSFGAYKTSDLFRRDVNIKADITNLPIPDCSYDLIYASHVLEHVPNDRRAIEELYRILKPGGMAILPVPIHSTGNRSSADTKEYEQPNMQEDGHVRAPGLDYFDRYRAIFKDVEIFSSDQFSNLPHDNQLYIRPPSAYSPTNYDSIPEYVPVCRK